MELLIKNFSNKVSMIPFHNALLGWYDAHKRDLPWRKTKDPYKIWLSEVMLQQTTVQTVIPYYRRFLSRFPTVKAVAKAREADLLHAWAGLGYYSRIRQFQKAAKIIANQRGGKLPRSQEALSELPGFGPYTSAAVASIAFGEPVAVVDGNVKRVISRLFAYRENILASRASPYFAKMAQSLQNRKRPGDFNQAMMELGATICRPRAPLCLSCPVSKWCQAYAEGEAEKYPVKIRKTKYREEHWACRILFHEGKYFLKKRSASEILPGMWEFPQKMVAPPKEIPRLPPIKHSIMNRRMTIHPLFYAGNKNQKGGRGPGKWFSPRELEQIPLTTISKKIIRMLPLTYHI